MNQEQQELIPQKIMTDIHRLVQKLKEMGMSVDSSVSTTTSLVDDTVKYTDTLTITGDFTRIRFDTRTPAEVKIDAEKQKAAILAKHDELVAQVDQIITVVDLESKQSVVIDSK